MTIRLKPVLVSGLDIVWPLVEEGLLAIERKTGPQEETIAEIRNGIRSGFYPLLLVERDRRYIGFIVGKINQVPHGLEFCIYKGYKASGDHIVEPDVLLQLKTIVKRYKCTVITFYSTRKGWERQAPRYGFTKGHTQYCMEV